MKTGYTHILMVVDKSGSMQPLISDTIGGFNKFLADQKAASGEATMDVVLFDTTYTFLCKQTKIQDVAPLSDTTYVPQGYTALLDAVGRGISETTKWISDMPEDARPSKVVVVIITDGAENSSREYKKAGINDMITRQRAEHGWEFLFLGANQDAITEAANMGIYATQSASFSADPYGTRAVYETASLAVKSVRSGGSVDISNAQRDSLLNQGKR